MKIDIKGQKYEIKRQDIIDNDMDISGQIQPIKKVILISKQNSMDIDSTILHELVHGYLQECGLIKLCRDEDLVDWIAYHIPQIVRTMSDIRNSKFYKDLIK